LAKEYRRFTSILERLRFRRRPQGGDDPGDGGVDHVEFNRRLASMHWLQGKRIPKLKAPTALKLVS
jgi:hypothetical protein